MSSTTEGLRNELKRRFPWLGTEEDAGSGAEVISTLTEWYAEVSHAPDCNVLVSGIAGEICNCHGSVSSKTKARTITASLEIIYSKKDGAGNVYFAFRYHDLATDKIVEGKISGGESNVRGILFVKNGGSWEPHDVLVTETQLGVREFERLIKTWPYAGCDPANIWAFIAKELGQ